MALSARVVRGKKAGVVAGYLAMIIQNTLSFFLTPFMLAVLGDSEFGVYRLVLSITSYFALADLGLSNAVVRYISEYRSKADKEAEGRFVALIIVIDVLAGLLIVAAAAIMYHFIPDVFRNSFSSSEVQLLLRLFILLVVNGVFSLFLNLATGLMKSYSEFGLLKAVDIARSVVRAASIVALLLTGYDVFAVVLVDTALTGIVLAFATVHCIRRLMVRPQFGSLTYPYTREILAYSTIVFVDALAFHLLNSADSIIIGIKISSAAVAVYSIGVVISALFHALSVVISDVLMPDVVEKVASGVGGAEMTDYMVRIGRIKLLVLGLPTLGFAFLGREFVTLWVGQEYVEAYYVALIVIIPSMLAGLSDVGLYVMWAMKKHKVKSAVSLAIAALNIVITVALVDVIGLLGAAIGTSVAWVVGYNLFNGFYFHRVLKLDMLGFYQRTFSRTWIAMAAAAAVAIVVRTVGTASWSIFFVQVFAVTAAYTWIAWRIALDDSEKTLVRGLLGSGGSRVDD